MNFAALESSLASVALATFGNFYFSYGAVTFFAELRRGVDYSGEYGITEDKRDRITVARADAAGFANGLVIQADPSYYTVAELLAMDRTSWTLERKDSDDGQLVSWWIK